MDKATFDKYLDERYYDQMKYYDKKSGQNQKKYKDYQWLLIILSALTPVLVALSAVPWFKDGNGVEDAATNEHIRNVMQIVIVVISSIVAILTTGMKSFQYQELWVSYRATQEQLKPEIYYYQFNVGPYGVPGVDKETLFVIRIESILDKEHASWPPAKKLNDDESNSENKNGDSDAENPNLERGEGAPVQDSTDLSNASNGGDDKSRGV